MIESSPRPGVTVAYFPLLKESCVTGVDDEDTAKKHVRDVLADRGYRAGTLIATTRERTVPMRNPDGTNGFRMVHPEDDPAATVQLFRFLST